ncbi:MAG TPA: carbohydrate-binding family 9-like protein [Polyangiales bacterium]
MRSSIVACSLLALCAVAGCVEKSAHESTDKVMLAEIKLKQPPKPQHPLNIRFETQVRLLGYDIDRTTVVPEQPFKVTWYWQVDRTLGEDWQLFTHVADGANRNRLNLDADRALRRVYPVAEWKTGDLLKDPQEITLPKNWGSESVTFYMGFYSGPHRLHVTQGPSDGDNRAEALKLPVLVTLQPKPLPQLLAHPLTGKITLDGKLDEPDWQTAGTTGRMVNTMTSEVGGFAAVARVAYDAQNLYIGFVVQDDYLRSTFEKKDEHLWEQDAVEVMIDPDGDSKNYFELQVSPRGVSFDTRYDAPRDPLPFGHVDWDSHVQAKVTLEGTLDDEQPDRGYTVEMAIPFTAFAVGATPAPPPTSGSMWRMNFFVMDARKQGQRAVAWSAPLVGDFHTLARFGRVTFTPAPLSVPVAVPVVMPAPAKSR